MPGFGLEKEPNKKYFTIDDYAKFINNYNCDSKLILISPALIRNADKSKKFLRATYQSIVRVETMENLQQIEKDNFIIIYGDQDNMVNPHRLYELSDEDIKKRIKFIKNGGHDIANTHTKELVNIVDEFINK